MQGKSRQSLAASQDAAEGCFFCAIGLMGVYNDLKYGAGEDLKNG